jgi:plasmid replication initiation protein
MHDSNPYSTVVQTDKQVKAKGMAEHLIVKSNELVEASYSLSIDETRLIVCALAGVDSRKEFPDKISIHAEDFALRFGCDSDSVYKQIRMAGDSLFEKSIVLDTSEKRRKIRWLQEKADYKHGEGRIDLYFSNSVRPFLGQLTGNFSSYKARWVSDLTNRHSHKLYDGLIRSRNSKKRSRTYTLEAFRESLGLGQKYSKPDGSIDWTGIRRAVIVPAIGDLNAKTDILVKFKPVKNGRKVHSVCFTFDMSYVTNQGDLDI